MRCFGRKCHHPLRQSMTKLRNALGRKAPRKQTPSRYANLFSRSISFHPVGFRYSRGRSIYEYSFLFTPKCCPICQKKKKTPDTSLATDGAEGMKAPIDAAFLSSTTSILSLEAPLLPRYSGAIARTQYGRPPGLKDIAFDEVVYHAPTVIRIWVQWGLWNNSLNWRKLLEPLFRHSVIQLPTSKRFRGHSPL